MSTSEKVDSSSEEKDDISSFTNVTTLTLTDSSSQMTARSEVVEQLQHDNMIENNLDEKLENNDHIDELLLKLKEVKKIEELQEMFQECLKAAVHHGTYEESGMKELKVQIKELQNENKELRKLSKKQDVFVKANDTLNEYISESEQHRIKEISSLKARLSLTKMITDVQKEQHLQSTLSLAEHQNASMNDSVENVTPKKRSRRSSILFWRKKSNSSKTNSPSSSLTPTIHENVNLQNLLNEAVGHELEEKYYEIEDLTVNKDELEKRVLILEENLQSRNIELSAKSKRNKDLIKRNNKTKQYVDKCCCLLNEINGAILLTTNKVMNIENTTKENRNAVHEHYKKLEHLDWKYKSFSEENKILQTCLNAKNYEIQLQKLQLKNYKRFLVENVIEDESFNSLNDVCADDIIKIADSKIKNNQNHNSNHLKLHQSTQTIYDEKICFSSNSDSKEEIMVGDSKDQIKGRSAHNDRTHDSGVALTDQSTLTSQIFNNINDGRIPKFNVEENDEEGYVEQIVSYVESVKDRQIQVYVQDLTMLEGENMKLRHSLHTTNQTVERLNHELEYQKHVAKPKQPTPPPVVKLRRDTFVKRRPVITYSPKSPSKPQQCDRNTVSFTETQSPCESDITPDNNLFLHSYEKGSALIRDIIKEKNNLENELSQSRKLVQTRKRIY